MINADVHCECCSEKNYEYISRKRGYKIYRCLSCGLFSIFPQPSKISLLKIYSDLDGYHSTLSKNLSKTSSDYALHLDRLLLDIVPNKGYFLDVGCSNGQLIYHLRKLGWVVKGIDINSDSIRVAISHGLDVQQCEIGDLDVGDKFDVIYMGDVIEHVLSPSTTIEAAFNRLRKNGVLIINTPNADCGFGKLTRFLSKFTGFPWPQSEAPFHLHEFTESTLIRMLLSSGFKVYSKVYSGGSSFLYIIGSTGYFDKLKKELKSKGEYHFEWILIQYFPLLCAVTFLLAPFFVVGKISDRILKKGAKLSVFAVK